MSDVKRASEAEVLIALDHPLLNGRDRLRVYHAAKGGRATQEIAAATGLPEGIVVGHLLQLVSDGRIAGVPTSAPWYVLWAHVGRRRALGGE